MDDKAASHDYHEDAQRFRQALTNTEAQTGFSARLIEKDYYCSLILRDLLLLFQKQLVFKGGTCLSKVHTQFFRLSEDLDFAISVSPEASRADRRESIAPIKVHLQALEARLACFSVSEPLQGHATSRQYNGRVAYSSLVTGEHEYVSLEVSLRENTLLPTELLPAATLLQDPFSGRSALAAVTVRALSRIEAYAEKIRAALSRRDPAIRDFFDLDHALRQGLFDDRSPQLIELVSAKLSIAGNQAINLAERRKRSLRDQVETQLRPVLRSDDYAAFDLERVIGFLERIVADIS